MKTKLLITLLGLIATSAYAQPSIPSVGMPPPTVRAEIPRAATPSMPQPVMQRPVQSNPASSGVGAVPVNPQEQENIARMITLPPIQPAVGATGGAGGNGGKGGLIMGDGGRGGNGATQLPPTMPRGVGPSPLKNDDVGVQKEYVRYEEYEKGDFDVTKTPYAPGNGNVKAYMK